MCVTHKKGPQFPYITPDKALFFSKKVFIFFVIQDHKTYEPAHDKTYQKTCVTSKGSDQPVHPANMARVLVSPSLGSLKVVESRCDQ